MPSTTKSVKRHFIRSSKQRNEQRSVSKGVKRNNINGYKSEIPVINNIPASRNTGSFDTSTLKLASKLGYDILKDVYRKKVDFSVEQKKEVYMLHMCMRHIPGYVNKKFTNVNDAICHVYKQVSILITNQWMFTSHDNTFEFYPNVHIPEEFNLNIIHETFSPAGIGRWQSYNSLYDHASGNRSDLRLALSMCMHIMINKFGFSLFDWEGGTNVMSMTDWYENEVDMAISELEHLVEGKTTTPDEIKDAENNIQKIKDVHSTYYDEAVPIQKEINKTRINVKWLKKIAEKYGGDFQDWVELILYLYKRKFNIINYCPEGFNIGQGTTAMTDEDSYPYSSFGYVYDGDNAYSESVNEYFNEVMNNVGSVPFMNFEVINSVHGVIRELSDEPVLEWIIKLFTFNFEIFAYESDRSSPSIDDSDNVQEGYR